MLGTIPTLVPHSLSVFPEKAFIYLMIEGQADDQNVLTLPWMEARFHSQYH